MHNTSKVLVWSGALIGLIALGQMAACTTDDTGDNAGSAGTTTTNGGSTSDTTENSGGVVNGTTTPVGGAGGSSSTSTSTSAGDTICAGATVLGTGTPGIADFDAWAPGADLGTWSFPLGGDSSTEIYAGPFTYGDDHTVLVGTETKRLPEVSEMAPGAESTTYALRIYDTLSEDFGGGMGLWLSKCLDASAFTGISFWARGIAPTGKAKFSLNMEETTSTSKTPLPGTCDSAVATECINPSYEFALDADPTIWTEVKIPWGAFKGGSAAGTAVSATGKNIWQLQFDIGLVWPAEGVSTDAEYELVIDSMKFYQ